MTSGVYEPTVRYAPVDAADLDVDLLMIPVCEDEEPAEVAGLDQATGGALRRARESGEFRGKPYELFLTSIVGDGWRAARLAAIGAGPKGQLSSYRIRLVAAAAGLAAHQRRVARAGFVLRGDRADPHLVQAGVEGLLLGAFEDRRYKSDERSSDSPHEVIVGVRAGGGAVEDAVERGRRFARATNLARALANEPSNVLTPRVFAERAIDIVGGSGVGIEVLDEQAIARLKMGLLLGVAKGSAEPPRLIVMRHEPPGAPSAPVLGLVGKGVTFDTGGISIKPAESMERMKEDMSGGAAVICAMRAIGELRAPIRVIGVVPATENMPGGRAIKPGDILTGSSGKTVEVINTDAEGRLILGDALWHAQQLGATHLVDIATLTGACVVALGKVASGLFGVPDGWRHVVARAADRAGDRVWPMPLFEDYADQLRSEMADMINTGGRPGGACTAATFLKEFTGGLPWAHLDIAGTAWLDDAKPYMLKGATGVGVRTLVEVAFSQEGWGI